MSRIGPRSLALVCALSCACQPAKVSTARNIRVSVSDGEGHALAGVPIEIDGLSATKTAADGHARLSLSAAGPARARIGVSCGVDRREAPPRHVPRAVVGGSARLELSFVCAPRLRKLAIVVRAPGAQGLLLRADGEPVGRIESDGTLHATVSRVPDSELRLTIDTGDLPITPSQPLRVVHVFDRDELVIFDQALTRRRARRVVQTAASSAAPLRGEQAAPFASNCLDCEERSPACMHVSDAR